MKVELQTVSYAGDFKECALLCETIDRFAPEQMSHTLIVPATDLAQFGHFRRVGRKILPLEVLLPGWLRALPLPRGQWRRHLPLFRRDVFLSLRSAPVRGWIVQQIGKIAATLAAEADVVVHVDSDCAFVRPFSDGHFLIDGSARCYRNPSAPAFQTHAPWHEAASRLFGLPPTPYHGADYIDSVVTWHRPTVRAMVERIEAVRGHDWRVALARTARFSEYILYGVFYDRVAAGRALKLHFTSVSLSHTRWRDRFQDEADRSAFVSGLERQHIACTIQSTIGLESSLRHEIIGMMIREAAVQDAGQPSHPAGG